MAKNSKSSFAALNDLPNMKINIRKSDQTRRTVGHVTAEVGNELAECQSPAEIGEHAEKHGLRPAEIIARAESAPNFGQFRMVIGNRIRGITARMEAGMTLDEAAYPKEASKARREQKAKERAEAKAAKIAAKAAAKATKPVKVAKVAKTTKPAKAIAKAKPIKKGKKAPNPSKGIKIRQVDGTLTNSDGSAA